MTMMTEDPLYKVVQKGTRFGSNWAIFSRKLKDKKEHQDEYNEGLRYRKEHPELFPRYFKGHIIEAPKYTIGLMMFTDLYTAILFQKMHSGLSATTKVIRVEPLDEVYNLPKGFSIIGNCGSKIQNLNLVRFAGDRRNENIDIYTSHKYKLAYIQKAAGIVTCHKIKVLE